jgi:hypothetical protein
MFYPLHCTHDPQDKSKMLMFVDNATIRKNNNSISLQYFSLSLFNRSVLWESKVIIAALVVLERIV